MSASRVCAVILMITLQVGAWSDNRTWTKVPKYTLNLDLPPQERWTHIVADFKQHSPQITAYLESQIPKWALPIITSIAKDIRPYFALYGDEMLGLAAGYGLPIGDIVAINLVYQLESIGINCTNWNVTGPTTKDDPGCVAIDPKQDYCYCKDPKLLQYIDHTGILQPPKYRDPNNTGLCTSIVANTPAGDMLHGRNLDWNVPPLLRKLMVDVEFQSKGVTIFTGTTLVGFVGVMNGMQQGQDGWSVSLDARGKGGKLLGNILQALLHKSMTPTQHIRHVLETPCDVSTAISQLGQTPMIDEAFFIVAGAHANGGGVLSRARNKLTDYWPLNTSDPQGWYRLETNYDHWNPVPKADDRRHPAHAHMDALGPAGVTPQAMMRVMSTYPTYNWHTDYTCVINPHEGVYESGVWL